MQGLYRIILALVVVIHHLSHSQAWFSGNFAVLGFYALSGYLITGAVKTNYGIDLPNLKRFAANRFLRLFPGYWAALAIAAVAITLFPVEAISINRVMHDPSSIRVLGLPVGWIPQFTMVGLQVPPATLWPIRLIPPAWSTAIEVYFYIALALTSTLSNRAFGWIFAGTALAGLACALTGKIQWTYTSEFGVAVLFAAGSMAWRERERLQITLQQHRWITPCAILTYFAIAVAPDVFHSLREDAYLVWGQYAVVPLVALLVHASINTRLSVGLRLDAWLADLSYPVFLLHFPTSAIVRGVTGLTGLAWVECSIVTTFVLAAVIVLAIDRPISGVRRKLRQRSKS